MADLNIVYAPIIEYFDPDVIIAELPGPFPWSDTRKVYLSDEAKDYVRKLDTDSASTASAVKEPYTGTTSEERLTYLTRILQAVNNRVQFISERSNQILNSLKDNDGLAYQASLKIFTTAVAAVPVVGSVISYIVGKDQAAQAIEVYMQQTLIKNYAADLGQLAEIRTQLTKEYKGATGIAPVMDAPTPWPVWYYYVGAAVILLLLLYIRKRNLER